MATETATYYFNAHDTGEKWETTPANMVDGNTSNYATDTNDDAVQLLTGNTSAGVYLGKISSVEIRGYGKRATPTPLNLVIRPVFSDGDGDNHSDAVYETAAYSPYFDITTDTNAPSTWNWDDVEALDCDVEVDEVVAGNTLSCSNVQIKVTYDTEYIELNDGTTYIYLDMPTAMMESTTKTVQNIVFNDGNDVQVDRGKTGDALTLSGTETSSVTATMQDLNTIIDEIVTVSGLPDSNLNTDYRISNFDFNQEAGMPDIYSYNITLERIYDRLG